MPGADSATFQKDIRKTVGGRAKGVGKRMRPKGRAARSSESERNDHEGKVAPHCRA